jgi:hypothetical protein
MFGFEKVGKCVSEYGVAAERQRPTLDILNKLSSPSPLPPLPPSLRLL